MDQPYVGFCGVNQMSNRPLFIVLIYAITVGPTICQAQGRNSQQLKNAELAFQVEVAAARKAGLAVSLRDVKVPMPPADQNAATYYAQLGKLKISSEDW